MSSSGKQLKPWQFQPGHKPASKGRPKGSKSWSTELTLELLCDAALIDPDTGKRMSAKSLKRRLSKHIWSDARILLNYLDRRLGRVQEKVDQKVTFVIERKDPPALANNNVQFDSITIPAIEEEVVDNKEET